MRSPISQGPGRPAVRPPFRHHGGCFLLDLAAGSLALEKIGKSTRVSVAKYGKKHAEDHEAQYSGTISYQYCTAPGGKSERNKSGSCAEPLCSTVFNNISEEVKIGNKKNKNKKTRPHVGGAHPSVPADFMIVSLPDDAAFTICCSTDWFILALSACIIIQSGCMARERGARRDQKEGGKTDLPCAWMPA